MATFIKIQIDAKGNASIELDGFHGIGCAEVMDALTNGSPVTHRAPKPEMFEATQDNDNALVQGQGQ